jgi:secreted trypsin-like serine protease
MCNVIISSILLLYILLFPYFTCAISGGKSVPSSQQYPFSVTLVNNLILCGGSIISLDPPYILTAAHCIEDFNINYEKDSSRSVAYGDRDFSLQSHARVKRVISHPLYIPSSSSQNQVYAVNRTDTTPYDIGLIELTKPLVANINVNRIRLYVDQDNDSRVNITNTMRNNNTTTASAAILETIGMGYTGFQQPHANLLQYAKCNSHNITPLRDNNYNNSIILAISDAGLCHGDSGKYNNKAQIIGIILLFNKHHLQYI